MVYSVGLRPLQVPLPPAAAEAAEATVTVVAPAAVVAVDVGLGPHPAALEQLPFSSDTQHVYEGMFI